MRVLIKDSHIKFEAIIGEWLVPPNISHFFSLPWGFIMNYVNQNSDHSLNGRRPAVDQAVLFPPSWVSPLVPPSDPLVSFCRSIKMFKTVY